MQLPESTSSPGIEREFQSPRRVIYSIPRLLVITVYVSKPAHPTAHYLFEVSAMGIQKGIIILVTRLMSGEEDEKGGDNTHVRS